MDDNKLLFEKTTEMIELSAIAMATYPDMWNTYIKNGECSFSTFDMKDKNIIQEVEKEVSKFWSHDWLLNDGAYFIKLLTTSIIYLEKITSCSMRNIIQEKSKEFEGKFLDVSVELRRLKSEVQNKSQIGDFPK
jgi:hypothetical protein